MMSTARCAGDGMLVAEANAAVPRAVFLNTESLSMVASLVGGRALPAPIALGESVNVALAGG
ncbi:MAG: hypothetical protein EAZ43_16735 [Betaproteobacteria bacterium]|nr:MAG: hypothetical protein EAZ43_16735 [Betaproteobacteria bacterium]